MILVFLTRFSSTTSTLSGLLLSDESSLLLSEESLLCSDDSAEPSACCDVSVGVVSILLVSARTVAEDAGEAVDRVVVDDRAASESGF